ncbi:ALP1-like protein isoform X1 [Tanacetum coccineum]
MIENISFLSISETFAEDNEKPMNDLVDGTRNKVGAPPRKTRIWSGKKAKYSSENNMLSLVIWHAFFGLSGLNNDINILQQSRLFNDPKEGKAPEILFMAHGVTYPWGYYLVDGMYPELTTLIKTISEPSDDEYK